MAARPLTFESRPDKQKETDPITHCNSATEDEKKKKEILVSVVKPTKESSFGMTVHPIEQSTTSKGVLVTQIDSNGLFANTDLREGMVVVAVNGRKFRSFELGVDL